MISDLGQLNDATVVNIGGSALTVGGWSPGPGAAPAPPPRADPALPAPTVNDAAADLLTPATDPMETPER